MILCSNTKQLRFWKAADHRKGIKFCVNNEIKCAARTFEMLNKAFGEPTMSGTQLSYNWFKESREDVSGDAQARQQAMYRYR